MHLCNGALPIAAEIQAILKVGTPRAPYCFLWLIGGIACSSTPIYVHRGHRVNANVNANVTCHDGRPLSTSTADTAPSGLCAGWQPTPGAGARQQVVHLRLQPAAARLHQPPGPRLVIRLHARRPLHGHLSGWQLLHQLLPVDGARGRLWSALLHVPAGVGAEHRLRRVGRPSVTACFRPGHRPWLLGHHFRQGLTDGRQSARLKCVAGTAVPRLQHHSLHSIENVRLPAAASVHTFHLSHAVVLPT